MKLLNNIKARIGSKVIDGKVRVIQRKACFVNLDEARSIGIIYDATETVTFNIIKDFAQHLSERNINLNVLGYVDRKELSEQLLYRKGFNFFCRKHLNWYFRPVSPVTDEFIKEQFDILLNLSLDDRYPVKYITALSAAKFKAGKYSSDDRFLDLMIDITRYYSSLSGSRKNPVSESPRNEHLKNITGKSDTEMLLKYLIDQLIHYLSIIKKN